MTFAPRVTAATRREVLRATGIDPVTELGILEADEEAEFDAADIVVVMRHPCAHTANAHLERCSVCKHKVWVAATTPRVPKRVCLVCFVDDRQLG